MKFNSILIYGLLAASIVGCGGGSSNLDSITAPTVQRMLAGGAPRAVQSDAVATATVNIAGYRDNYTIAKNQTTNVVTVTSNIDNSVTTYQNPNLIKFVDKWTSFDIDGAAGQVYRLYQAAFNRKPDLPGLGFWIAANQNGRELIVIASDFIISAEFKSMYGDKPTNLKLVSSFYNNVLHRDGEKAGVDWWVGQMNGGATANGVLFGFSDSAENKNNLQAAMQNGFDYVPFNQGGPIIPQASSYLNAKNIGIGSVTLPSHWSTAPVDFIEISKNANRNEGIQAGFALGDFFQEGKYSLVAFTNAGTANINDPDFGKVAGHVYFYKKDALGNWVDHTPEILKDQTGCISARKVIVADFNGDGKPDVFAACHGIDRELKAGEVYGEHPRMLLSQLDGTYKNVDMGFDCYCHGAAAAVMNADGYADIVVTDPKIAKQPFFMINNKNGTFTKDLSKMPADAAPVLGGNYGREIWSVELIDFKGTGKFDLWLGGSDDGLNIQFTTSIFNNPGDDYGFFNAKATVLPSTTGVSTDDDNPLDITFTGGQIYLGRVNNSYSSYSIQKIDYKTLSQSVIYQNKTEYKGAYVNWVDWLIPYGGQIVALNSIYPVAIK